MIIMAGLSTAFSVFLLLFLQCHYNVVSAQHSIEILEPAPFGTHHPIFRCDATVANLGEDKLAIRYKISYLCASPFTPINACGNVTMPATVETSSCYPFFAVVSGSNCSFTEKAFNVRKTRIDILIVDDKPGKVIESMSGDKYSNRIKIPVVMVDSECMKGLLYPYNYRDDGYIFLIILDPEYKRPNRPFTYVALFVAVIMFVLALILLSKIIGFCQDRRNNQQLPKSSSEKVSILNSIEVDSN